MAKTAEVNVKTTADTKGADQASKAIDKLKRKTDELTKAQKKNETQQNNTAQAMGNAQKNVAPLAHSFSSVGSVVNMVNPKMGMMIQGVGTLTSGLKGLLGALKSIIANPIALVIMAATAVIGKWVNELNKAKEGVKNLIAEMGKVSGIEERNARVKKSYDEMARAIENVNDKVAHENEMYDMMIKNYRSQQDAKLDYWKQRELAGAKTDKDRQWIEDEYANRKINLNADRRKEDIQRASERTYTATDKENYAKQREQSTKEIAAQMANIAGIKAQLENNRKIASGETKTGTSVGNFFLGKDTAVIDEEDQKTAEKNMEDLMKQLREAESALEVMKNNAMKNDREEQQAKEKQKRLVQELAIVDEQEKAEIEALNTAIKMRAESEQKARKENERAVSETLKNDAKQGEEWQWGRDYDSANTNVKKEMLEAKIKRAKAESEKARKEMEEASKGDPNDKENQRRLQEAQQRFNENQGTMRSATSSLDELTKQNDGVVGFKLADRISAMGGFATAGAKAVAGLNANTPEAKALKEAEKQTKQGAQIQESVKVIERNTSQTVGCFA